MYLEKKLIINIHGKSSYSAAVHNLQIIQKTLEKLVEMSVNRLSACPKVMSNFFFFPPQTTKWNIRFACGLFVTK